LEEFRLVFVFFVFAGHVRERQRARTLDTLN
jgi:hypothetical protein